MEERYQWSDINIQSLRNATQTTYDALAEATALTTQLTADMTSDTTWEGEHKLSFMAWMDLVRQFLVLLSDQKIGPAAIDILDGFAARLADFYENSPAYVTLRGVG